MAVTLLMPSTSVETGLGVPVPTFAKDGFALPAQQATVGPSEANVASGETADFEFTPDTPGDLKLEVDRLGPFRFHAALALHVRSARGPH